MYKLITTGLLWVTLVGCSSKPTLDPPPRPAPDRDGKWVQDVRYVCDNIARLHCDAFRFLPKATFEAARDQLVADIPALSDAEITIRLAAVIALLEDGHTQVAYGGPPHFPNVPVRIRNMAEGFRITGIVRSREDLLAGRVVAIDGVPIDEVLRRLDPLVNNETDRHLRWKAARLLSIPVVLHHAGVTPSADAARYHIETPNGVSVWEAALPGAESQVEYATVQPTKVPLALKAQSTNYWHERIPDSTAMLVAYNKCQEDPKRPFAAFAKDVLKDLEDPTIDRLILDLRRNVGGSQPVGWPLMKQLIGHRLDKPGGIVVLLGRETYSSGFGTAMNMRDWTHAVWIGTPFPQKPHHFGQAETFLSPNFKLTCTYSTKWFAKGSGKPEDYEPEIFVETPLSDWLVGRDRCLEAALAYRAE